MSNIYTEENGIYCIDCSKAIWSTDQIHERYKAVGNFLSDVDFIIETKDKIILVEYKNASIEGASNPEAFKPETDKKVDSVVRKFYDTLWYLKLAEKNKPVEYVYILEYPSGDSVSRKGIRNRIKDKLPFQLQKKFNNNTSLIENFEVCSIDEWNNDSVYGMFPLKRIDDGKVFCG